MTLKHIEPPPRQQLALLKEIERFPELTRYLRELDRWFQTFGARVNDNSVTVDDTVAVESLIVACSNETSALTTGTAKMTFRFPYAFTLTEVRASLSTTQTSGNIFTVDINKNGTTILSTKLTIDNGEETSESAATPAVISDTAIADDAEITIDIDQVGDGTAKGLKVTFIGSKT